MLHTNKDKKPDLTGLQVLTLKERREVQVDKEWHRLPTGTQLYKLTDAQPLSDQLRQCSKFAEDWEPTYCMDYNRPVWCVVWIPRLQVKAQIRDKDIETNISKNSIEEAYLTKITYATTAIIIGLIVMFIAVSNYIVYN